MAFTFALVVGDTGSPPELSSSVKTALEAEGHTCSYVDDAALTSSTVCDAAYIHSSSNSVNASNSVGATFGIICSRTSLWAAYYLSTEEPSGYATTSVELWKNSSHWISVELGYSENDTPALGEGNTNGYVTSGVIGSGAVVLCEDGSSAGRIILLAYEADSLGTGDNVLAGRRVLNGMYDEASYSAQVSLLVACLKWAAGADFSSATALPRRALDGPFYGSIRGSVR